MAMKSKLGFSLLLLLSVLVLCASLALAKEDPELRQCKHQCKVQQQFDEKQTKRCIKRCKDYYEHKKGSDNEEQEWGGGSGDLDDVQEEDERRERKEREGEEENPYVFGADYFLSKVKTTLGSMFELPNFGRLSKFLRGIERYKLGMLAVLPERFLTPNHLDADALFFVFSGQGTITVIHENKRHRFQLEKGVLFGLPAGTPYYVVNSDDREPLAIAQFLVPVNIPGNFEPFFVAAGRNPESFLRTFSQEVVEAAFKVSEDELKELLERKDQDQGVFVRASEEQIRALSDTTEEEGGGIWPFDTQSSKATYNIFKKRPVYSNEFGQHYEVNLKDYPPLQYLEDLAVSFYNISQGAMVTPFYDSKSTNLVVVVSGKGIVEIVCPHVSSSKSSRQEQQGSSQRRQEGEGSTVLKNRVSYRKIRAEIATGTALVFPAGHPVVIVASSRDNLELLSFRINAKNNERYVLAGKRNVVKGMDKEAKELAFSEKEEKVDRVFGHQEGQFFVPGPYWRRQQGQGRAYE